MRRFFKYHNIRINRLSFFIVLFNIFLLIIFFKIQILDNSNYEKIVNSKGWKNKTIFGKRGKILDANGKSLAISISKYDFWVNTNQDFNKNKISILLSETFNKPIDYYIEKLNRKSNYVLLERNCLYLEASNILEEINSIEGLRYNEKNNRFYPYNNLACQVLGYVNLEGKGVYGIEENFNNILSGDTSKIKLKKALKGKYLKHNEKNNINGYEISLTIDVDYQKILDEEIKKVLESTNALSANGLIINPNTGDIIAMSSMPDFDPNNYFNYNIKNYSNRVICDSYEPGSTFKIVALSQALESNKYTLKDSIHCDEGKHRLSNNKILTDHEPHGMLSLLDIFAYSSNIGTAKLINSFNNIEYYELCKKFGFGNKTGIPFKSESSGKIRSIDNWSKTSKNYISIGQEISATSLQIALAYCAIANGGYLMKPHIIKEIKDRDNLIYKRDVKPIRHTISNNTSNTILEAMEKVVSYGTAKEIGLSGYKIGGKTGTAQKFINNSYSSNQFVSSFVSIYPTTKPDYVIYISIDSPDYGYHWANESAVPATKEIIKRIIIIDGTSENRQSTLLSNSTTTNKRIRNKYIHNEVNHNDKNNSVPNFKGKTFKEALRIANIKGLTLSPDAISGKIIWQSIQPGKTFENNEICELKLKL